MNSCENIMLPMVAPSNRSSSARFGSAAGFSLTELVVVMGIFLTVMLITSSSFKTIVNSSSQQSKSVESSIQGVVGLEIMRADLERTGFGLPWTFQTPITYLEASLDASNKPAANYWPTGKSAEDFNDAVTSASGNPPRAVLSANTKFNLDAANIGAKYLVIKSTAAATNDTARKWTSLSVEAGGVILAPRVWNSSVWDFQPKERVIVVKNNLNTTPPTRQLMASGSTTFSAKFSNFTASVVKKGTLLDGDTFQIYGIAPESATYPEQVRMPFNRADYYVMRPTDIPTSCAPNTGVLYKSNINQSPSSSSGGGYAPIIPLLDCVADMQVVYGLDTDGAGRINFHMEAPANTTSITAADIRSQLREIRVYILAQEGKRDILFKYPSATVDVGESFDGGTTLLGRRFNLQTLIGSGWDNYRWKLYTIVVRPKNLIQ